MSDHGHAHTHGEAEEEVEGLLGFRIGMGFLMIFCAMFVFIPFTKCCKRKTANQETPEW